MRVKATREGLIGHKTASGYFVDKVVPFVALPSFNALHRFVRLSNPKNGKSAIAIVLDIGPWNITDDDYVFRGERPKSERGISISGKGTNGSGIDLGEKIWQDLGMEDNSEVDWEFL